MEGEETEKVEEKRGREGEGEARGEKAGEGGEKREGKQSHSKERPSEAKVRSHDRSKERKEKEGRERRREATEHEPLERPQHKVCTVLELSGGKGCCLSIVAISEPAGSCCEGGEEGRGEWGGRGVGK